MHGSKEFIPSPEATSQQLLQLEFQHYVQVRGRIYSEADQAWQTDQAGERGLSRVQSNLDLLEDVGSHEEAGSAEPDITVCVPVAIVQEADETVLRTINALKKVHDTSGETVEVVLWANAEDKGSKGAKEPLLDSYNVLKGRLSELSGEGFRIRAALQLLQPEDAAMSNIRANLMDAVALDGARRGFAFEHPVLWLDADTTFMTGNALGKVAERIRCLDALFVHANLQYSIDWAEGKSLQELDDVSKAIAVHEIARRITVRFAGDGMPSGYVEESGLGFALGTYLWAGGVSTQRAMNESTTLMERAKYRLYHEEALPRYVFKKQNYSWPKMIVRVPGARVGTSARRHKVVAQTDGIEALNNMSGNYREGLGLFTHIVANDKTVLRTIKRAELYELLAVERQRRAKGQFYFGDERDKRWERRHKIVGALIDKYFEE